MNSLGVTSEFSGSASRGRSFVKPYPTTGAPPTSVLPVAMPRADARDPRWTTQRAVGSAAFLARSLPSRSRRILPVPPQIHAPGG